MNAPNTVIIFSTAYLPFLGGAELAIKEITERLPRVRFFLITARMAQNLPRREHVGNVDIYRVGIGMPFFDKLCSPLLAMLVARQLMKTHSVAHFWSVMVSFTSLGPFLLKTLRLHKNIPILLTLQEGDSEEHIKRARFGLVGVAWRFALRRADHVQVISSYLEELAREYGYTGEVTVVPNGVDLEKFQITNHKLQTKSKIQSPNIITISRLVYKNGVDVLIRAFAEVKQKKSDAKLHIVGDGPLRRELEGLRRIRGIDRDVIFHGSVSPEELPCYLAEADVFVRPSRSEGLGTAFLEAMAAGVPVIGTPVGGIIDFLENEETGLFSEVDKPESVADAIMRILGDTLLREKLSRRGRALVEERYRWDSIAEEMSRLLGFEE